uniref:Poly [ADP-ribose] polymerase n=1 Tax=Panagrolaimus davidi TaxID=227884 RepID=A0A914Q4H3_9BILA
MVPQAHIWYIKGFWVKTAEIKELRTVLSPEIVQKASEEFYSLIPHANHGETKFPLLDNPNIIDSKASMLNTLADIEIANRSIGDMILQTDLSRQDVISRYYEKLNCEITVLDHDSETFKLIEQYAQTNQRASEDFKLDIIDIFEINRIEEAERFNRKLGNIQLLWHGSRTVNFVGILSQGLHIPEKPRDLWFGKGVYFADTVCLSASYCDEEDSMLLLCEVALGNIDRKSNLDFELIQPDETKDSVKGKVVKNPIKNRQKKIRLGKWYPDRKGNCTIDGNVRIPMGQLIKREDKDDLILDYNEYIVYNINQIRIRYLVQVNIGKKGITRQNGLVANPDAV